MASVRAGGSASARAGARLAFGEPVNTYYRVENANVILSLDSDFLTSGPGHVRYAREFAAARRAEDFKLRLYAAESTPTSTGAKADHRWPMRAADVHAFAADLARQLGVNAPGPASAQKAPGRAGRRAEEERRREPGRCRRVPDRRPSTRWRTP